MCINKIKLNLDIIIKSGTIDHAFTFSKFVDKN